MSPRLLFSQIFQPLQALFQVSNKKKITNDTLAKITPHLHRLFHPPRLLDRCEYF